ncbi:class I fructose-bisphosphate aldolase [Nocardioides ganghwensis]|jgi:fructose-bisphosphate aldolase class I|uniref:Fructose-bisphosphate aldolase n=1 Tax=Nocardioides ganghwensis TaxID=252230 RepID=A0A4Q2SB63_9ACTN|nr:class I fructose-bisphosphate aldolase [Nocardioides ganghwensis]MBD3947120.1 fructose-bisphosphate aldolase class I [Nocardioides ganghwensis]RYC02019.1 fructose-bisphosphate aldolase class I [Nocardioides ganghwensis]
MTTPIESTARALVAAGKGILAADESTPTMAKRLAAVGLTSTEALRRDYREILFTTPDLGEHISGVILYDETIRQRASDGRPFAELLEHAGVVPGIKVDAGTTPLAGFPDEVVTAGLDGLRDRLAEYAALGARFAKWRAVIRIGAGRPSTTCVAANAQALGAYAALAQEAGLVPVVEPEVMMDGGHDIERCAEVTVTVLREVYAELARHRVMLEGTLLKPNMVLPGQDSAQVVDDRAVAAATLSVLRQAVPAAVPGIVFLSGGQSDVQATARLDALNRSGVQPWELSFSFGRALQAPVLRAWAGEPARTRAAHEALRHRAHLNGAARRGQYTSDLEALAPTGG